MYRLQIKYMLVSFFILGVNVVFAQKNERDYIRSGNKLYKDSAFIKAEVDYRKALDINPSSTESMYNLGNALSQQQKFKEAMEQYIAASKIEKNKMKLSQIYHNMGVIFQAGQQYPQALEAYKQALRNNPKDDQTRYNLALVQKLLKDQQDQQNQDNQDQQKDQEENKQDRQKDQEKQDNQNKDQEKEKEQQPEQPEKEKENRMSKENAEQLLNSVMQDEKDVQEKVKKMQQLQGKKLDKDW